MVKYQLSLMKGYTHLKDTVNLALYVESWSGRVVKFVYASYRKPRCYKSLENNLQMYYKIIHTPHALKLHSQVFIY